MTEGGPQPPIRNITQRSISRYGRFRIVFSCGQIDISSEKVRNTPITGHKKKAFRCLVWVGLSGGDGAEVEFAAGQV
ncbi:hypothetical protein, partial [Bifidobacterium longum]|uniref:hypothetical protein n=1 Tax=Bifidobacterium longum TaxID=216816 RepID=UPI001E4A00CB